MSCDGDWLSPQISSKRRPKIFKGKTERAKQHTNDICTTTVNWLYFDKDIEQILFNLLTFVSLQDTNYACLANISGTEQVSIPTNSSVVTYLKVLLYLMVTNTFTLNAFVTVRKVYKSAKLWISNLDMNKFLFMMHY